MMMKTEVDGKLNDESHRIPFKKIVKKPTLPNKEAHCDV